MSTSSRTSPFSRGFTLIELLVVVTIMFIITVVLLTRQSKFDSSTLLRSLAYSVALSVRQAQVYGGSVLGTSTVPISNCAGALSATGNCYASAYGVYFTTGSPSSYTLFADLDGNGQYTNGEDVKVFSLNNGFSIINFCATETASGNEDCQNGTVQAIANLSVVFRRPNPDACFATNLQSCAAGSTGFYRAGRILIRNNADTATTRNICVYQTGQIAVESPGALCP